VYRLISQTRIPTTSFDVPRDLKTLLIKKRLEKAELIHELIMNHVPTIDLTLHDVPTLADDRGPAIAADGEPGAKRRRKRGGVTSWWHTGKMAAMREGRCWP